MESGADIQVKTDDDETPLHWAAEGSDAEILDLMLVRGADLNVEDSSGLIPLYWAARGGNDETYDSLWDLSGGDMVNRKTADGRTLLHWAAESGNANIVRSLSNAGAVLDAKADDGDTPLILAVERGHAVIVQFLLANGAEAPEKTAYNGVLETHEAMQRAARSCMTDQLSQLIIQGGTVTDSIVALAERKQEAVEFLVRQQLRPRLRVDESGRLWIHKASGANYRELEAKTLKLQVLGEDGRWSLAVQDWEPGVSIAELLPNRSHALLRAVDVSY